jgi:acetyl esterase/lipase/rhamnogalacturonyl hydrolase YesR
MVERHALLKKAKANPFVNPKGYKEYVALKERAFRKTLAAQQDLAWNVKRDIPYADPAHERQVLDVYSPKKAKNLPVVFWIHGGGWQTGDKSSVQRKPQVFVDRGFVFVSTNYRLLPKVDMGTIIRDVAKSVRWVHDHIAEYGGDPKRLLVMGHSAGAQLAALTCTDSRYLKAEGLSLAIIKGCVPVDGDTYDVPAIIETAETRRRVHGLPQAKFGHREKFGNDPAKHRDFSAVTHVAKDRDIPPFLILHVAEHPDTSAQAQRLGNVLKAAGVPVMVFGARETTHNKINANLGLPDDPSTRAMYAFLDRVLKSGKVDSENQARTPRHVAEQLAAVYGKRLDQVAYIPALPLVAKLRLSDATQQSRYAEEVGRIVAPYLRGDKSPVPRSGSEQAGHLIFAELAARSKGKDRERWTLLCRAAADQIFGKDGKPLPLMHHHHEMSDAVFMAGPILAATGKLTGERKYFDAAVTHFASMRKLCLRRDGLYRHSPLCEAAWGRGNGFPALGLALALSDWPDDHPAKKDLIAEFRKHMAALRSHQDARTGCWHQVIDHPESYDEYSCTCMIGFAMHRGIRQRWLSRDDYQPCVDKAWRAVKERTSADGKLVNVCTGTGKQKTLKDYLTRPAINGRDDRGGAMGLLFATELVARK